MVNVDFCLFTSVVMDNSMHWYIITATSQPIKVFHRQKLS